MICWSKGSQEIVSELQPKWPLSVLLCINVRLWNFCWASLGDCLMWNFYYNNIFEFSWNVKLLEQSQKWRKVIKSTKITCGVVTQWLKMDFNASELLFQEEDCFLLHSLTLKLQLTIGNLFLQNTCSPELCLSYGLQSTSGQCQGSCHYSPQVCLDEHIFFYWS